MKKVFVLICSIVLAGSIAVGCASSSPELAAVQSQLNEIAGELDSLKQGNTEAAQSSQSPAAEPAPTASAAPAQTAGSGSKTVGEYGISGFETRVSELTAKMGTATLQDIGTIKQEMNQLERDMDAAEDQAEWDFRQGALSRTDYKEVERQIEHLEDELDYAEESMEYRLGYDD